MLVWQTTDRSVLHYLLYLDCQMDTWLVCVGLADDRQIGVALLIIPCLSNGYMACLCWFGRRQTDRCCTTYCTLTVKWIHGLFVLVWQTTDRSVLHYLLYLDCQMDTWLVCVGLADDRQIGVALLIIPCLSNGYMACLCWFGRRQTDRCCTTYCTLTVKWIHGLFVLVWQTTDRSVLHYLLYLDCQMDTWLVCVSLADDRQIGVALPIVP